MEVVADFLSALCQQSEINNYILEFSRIKEEC